MRISNQHGMDAEAFGPALTNSGEVWVTDGRLIPVAQLWQQFTPQPERRRAERRTAERRANRTRTNRRLTRRLRDALTPAELFDLARGPAWVRVYREEGV